MVLRVGSVSQFRFPRIVRNWLDFIPRIRSKHLRLMKSSRLSVSFIITIDNANPRLI